MLKISQRQANRRQNVVYFETWGNLNVQSPTTKSQLKKFFWKQKKIKQKGF